MSVGNPHELFAGSSRIAEVTSSSARSPIAATAPAQNTFPTTAASESIAFCSGGKVSKRAASKEWIEPGMGSSDPGRSTHAAALLDEQVTVLQQPQELLDVERVAFCSFEDRDPHLTDLGVVEQPGDELEDSASDSGPRSIRLTLPRPARSRGDVRRVRVWRFPG